MIKRLRLRLDEAERQGILPLTEDQQRIQRLFLHKTKAMDTSVLLKAVVEETKK
ncbi:hypothetical protein OK016_28000 [Vibrio chagasii]|nr:hypothetical protein [Vibrio chagasii]